MHLLLYALIFAGVSTKASISDHSCAVLNEGGSFCWGWNSAGQSGQARSDSATCSVVDSGQQPCVPNLASVTGLQGIVKSFALGRQHTCSIVGTGELWCWGRNAEGQIGIGGLGSEKCDTNGAAPTPN